MQVQSLDLMLPLQMNKKFFNGEKDKKMSLHFYDVGHLKTDISILSNAQKAYSFTGRKSEYNPSSDIQLRKFHGLNKDFIPEVENIDMSAINLISKFLKQKTNVDIEKIAVSANSSVYKISDENKQLAVKMQHYTSGIENGIIKRLHSDYTKELKSLRALPHDLKNVPKIMGEIRDGDNITAIITNFFDGNQLEGKYDYVNASMLKEMYKDFLILDKAEILHRDLTNNNILINEDTMYITDFGASKKFDELEKLSAKETKYKQPSFMYPSNLENFEFLGFLVYLRQLSNTFQNGEEKANKLFEEHLKLKVDYHKSRIEILKDKTHHNKAEFIKNETILADTFDYITKTENKEVKEDVINAELLKLKMLASQKMARLFFENDIKNYSTGLYWNQLEGVYNKKLEIQSKKLSEKYQDTPVLNKYFNLQLRLADFHYNEIYKPTIIANRAKVDSILENNEEKEINTIVDDGNRLATKSVEGKWLGSCACLYKSDKPLKGKF